MPQSRTAGLTGTAAAPKLFGRFIAMCSSLLNAKAAHAAKTAMAPDVAALAGS